VRHDISWFDHEANAVGILTARLESEASLVSDLIHPYVDSKYLCLVGRDPITRSGFVT